MYIIVLVSDINVPISVRRTLSGTPQRFLECGVAERMAHEYNLSLNKFYKNAGYSYVVMLDDGTYDVEITVENEL